MKNTKKTKAKKPEPVVHRITFTPIGDCAWTFKDLSRPSVAPAPESILAEAERVTSGDRQAQYGPPDQDFQRIAGMWTALKGVPFTAREFAMFMVCVKLSRETHQRKRDNWVDIAGYAKCGSLCGEGAQ